MEIYQNRNIFNDDAFKSLTSPDNVLYMKQGKNYIFGQDRKKVINFNHNVLEIKEFD